MISIEGQNLKRIRESKNIGTVELAVLAGVGQATISELESGIRKRPSSKTLTKLANALEVSVNELLGIEEQTEYELTDVEEIFKFILSANDVELDGAILTDNEKKDIEIMLNSTMALIRSKRSTEVLNEKDSNL